MAQRDSGRKRIKHDQYETPAWVTDCVIGHLSLRKGSKVVEPAAGSGKMVRALKSHGFKVESSDIQRGNRNFFNRTISAKAIITNPPYKLATEFIEHALFLTEPEQGIVAMLLRVDYDSGSTRRHLLADHPAFFKKVALTKRIEWFDRKIVKGKKQSGPSENHAWFIWRWQNKGKAPTIAYEP